MFDAKQLRDCVIKPALESIDLYSEQAENLLVMIAAHESSGGTYLKQVAGPALGIYQLEPDTYYSLWSRFLNSNDKCRVLASKILLACNYTKQPDAIELITNLKFATMMTRVFFLPMREAIPIDIPALAVYAKRYWNTNLGKATPEKYEAAYYRFNKIR